MTRDPSPALAAERYPRRLGLPAPVAAPSPRTLLPEPPGSSPPQRARFQWWSWPMARPAFVRSQKERVLRQFLRRGSFSCPKIELGGRQPVAGGAGGVSGCPRPPPRRWPTLWLPQAHGAEIFAPSKWPPGRSEARPQSCYNEVHSANR